MDVTPDTKDWTWVLQRQCPQCGISVAAIPATAVPGLMREIATQWEGVLLGDNVRSRPSTGVWSPLEYGCHVRDVFRLFDQRLRLMLTENDPVFANWDQDATAVAEHYGEQDPATVSHELREAALVLAEHFDAVPLADWSRSGRRSDGAAFTVESFARYLIHDPVHHLHDVTGQVYSQEYSENPMIGTP